MGSDKILNNDSWELREMCMYVYVYPAGLLGALVGRILRFRVNEFALIVDRNAQQLKSVEVQPKSLQPECEVFAESHLQRVKLTSYEEMILFNRLRFDVLESDNYPRIDFDVEQEDKKTLQGMLHLHGQSNVVKCTKTFNAENNELVVQCPVSLKQFNITPYCLWYGLFSQADKVLVETHVPSQLVSI